MTLILDAGDGEEQDRIETSHQVMANASSFFKVIAEGGFAESVTLRTEGKLELPLPDTNVAAMQVLCDIFHLRSQHVPTGDITSDMLYEIAVLVDRFDCASAIQPWAELWRTQSKIEIELRNLEDMDLGQVAKGILISSQLGYTIPFERLTSGLIDRAQLDDFDCEPLCQYFNMLTPHIQGMYLGIPK